MSFRGMLLKAGLDANGPNDVMSKVSESVVTSGTIRSLNLAHTERANSLSKITEVLRASLSSEYYTGDWVNAIVGRIDYGDAGDARGGMAAAICAEMNMPGKSYASIGGPCYSLDCEFNCPTGFVAGDRAAYPIAFLKFGAWGGAVGQFDDEGYIFHTDGLTAATGHVLGPGSTSLRVNAEGSDRYLALLKGEGISGDDLGLTGTATSAVGINGTYTNGVKFTGAFATHALNFDSVTMSTTLIGVGSYSSPVDQSCTTALISMGVTSDDADSWRYSAGLYIKGTGSGTKVLGLGLQSEYNGTVGADRLQGMASIALLGGGGEAGRLLTLGGDATAGMYAGWFKVGSNVSCVVDSGSRVAALWIDNQMNCVCSGEEYAMFITTGGSVPDAVMGFETTSSGWTNFILADETAYNKAPFNGAAVNTDGNDSDGSIVISLNSTTYYIPYFGAGKLA